MKNERNPNQKAFTVVHKTAPVAKPAPAEPAPEIDTAKAVAFAMSIAQEMKLRQKAADEANRKDDLSSKAIEPQHYSEDALDLFKSKLLATRDELRKNALTMKEAAGLNDSDDIEPDGGDGTNQSMRLNALSQLEKVNKTINDIDDALRHVENGTYGVCVSCGRLIAKERLLQRPFVKTCTTCQQALEGRR